MYSLTVKDHFANPRNVGELKNPDAVGTAKNKADGDLVHLHLRIREEAITDVRMKVMGCVAAIASTSLLTEILKDKTLKDAAAITREQLTDALGGLPENKINCSLTCIDALHEALEEAEKKNRG